MLMYLSYHKSTMKIVPKIIQTCLEERYVENGIMARSMEVHDICCTSAKMVWIMDTLQVVAVVRRGLYQQINLNQCKPA